MRHHVKKKILGRTHAPKKALLRNLSTCLIVYEKIKTTKAKAKWLKPEVEKIITIGKVKNLHNQRMLLKKLYSKKAVQKVFEIYGPRYKERKGGYLTIVDIGRRKGDSAEMSQIQFLK